MKIKLKLSIMVIAIMGIAITGVVFILAQRFADTSVRLTRDSIRNLARARAEYWKGRENTMLKILKTVADSMGDYESTPAE
jgi:hypothetical protein